MGKITKPKGVKLFAGVMFADGGLLSQCIGDLEEKFGEIGIKSSVFEFTFTDYYKSEMGPDLKKIFLGFKKHINPDELAQIKVFTNNLEEKRCSKEGEVIKRRINIDPGYLDINKVVLASTKYRSQRIYLSDGIYAEASLLFKRGGCAPLPWTYPDLKTQLACSFFLNFKNLD
jgi:hypothetical protein